MLRKWLLFSFAFAFAQNLEEGTYYIAGIRIEASEAVNARAITNLMGLYVGQRVDIPSDLFANAIRNLWKQKIFQDIRIEAEKVVDNRLYIVIKLKESPRIARYAFKGITKNQAEDLREHIQFIRGTLLTESKKRNAIRIIKNYFQEKGYYNTQVAITTRPDTTMRNGVLVLIDIKKGQRMKIKHIYFYGNEKIPDKKLKHKLKDTKEAKFYRFWKRSKFVKKAFKEDKSRLIQFYRSKGFRDAQWLKDSVVVLNKKRLALHIWLYEGPVYYFREIRWLGNHRYDDETLSKVLGIKRGDVYNTALLERRLFMDPNGLDVSSLYMDDGYLFFRAEPVEVAIENDSVDLEIRIFEGPQATIRKVNVEGNTKTSDWVIIRELRTLPGDKFSRANIIRSQREVLALGYFDPQSMNVMPQPNPQEGTVDITYKVAERPSDQVFLQGGWGGRVVDAQGRTISSGLVLSLGLTLTNFSTRKLFKPRLWNGPLPSGDGQRVSIVVQANGTGFQNYAFSFTEPWLGGKKPNTLGINANYSVQRSFFTDYYISIFGVSVDFGKRLRFPDDFFRSYTSLNYNYYVVRDPSRSVFRDFSKGFINILSLRQVIDRTSIDAPIYPRSGSIFIFTLEVTPPYSMFIKKDYKNLPAAERYHLLEFHKWKFDAGFYINLIGKMVLNPRMRFGFLGSYNPDVGPSPFNRFYLGGDGLQGFNLDGREVIALRGYRYPVIGGNYGTLIYNKFTIELRQALSLNPNAMFWVHAFFEAGNAWENPVEFNPFSLKRSIGVGIRVNLPMFGLMGVDYGYGLDPVYYNGAPINRGNFHFMIGQQF